MIHLNYGHKYLYDFDLIEYLAIKIGYRKVTKLDNNYDIPEKEIKGYLNKKYQRSWDIETETFILKK